MKITIITFLIVAFGCLMFDWGHTVGGFQGASDQWNCMHDFPDCGQLRQYELFPSNLIGAIKNFNVNDL